LKSKNTFVVANLIIAFMQSPKLSFLLEIIQEVGDFKFFLKGSLCSGTTIKIDLEEMHLFRFYVDSNGVPIMMYLKSTIVLVTTIR